MAVWLNNTATYGFVKERISNLPFEFESLPAKKIVWTENSLPSLSVVDRKDLPKVSTVDTLPTVTNSKELELVADNIKTLPRNQLIEKLRVHARNQDGSQKKARQKDSIQQELLEQSKRVQKLLNILNSNKPFVIQKNSVAQIDSSGTVGDSFGEINKLRQDLLIEPIIIEARTSRTIAPASSAGTPTAYGASSRQAYIGGGLRFPFDRKRDRVDGSLSFGFGEGDAINSLGVEFNFNITSVGGSFNDFDFGDSGTIGFKLHKYFGRGTAAAFGWSNPIRWGDSNASKATVYGVVTQAFPLLSNQLPLTISVGVGSGVFRSKGAILADENSPNLFASLGLQITPEISLVSSWTGNRLNVGASVVPIRKIPLVINAIFSDVTDNLNGGSGLTIVAGSTFQF
ncbi:MAG: hypothetical protein IGS39_08105 [Calothrix sp. C42_A2020_038]|nr:hypothetical protein [Calothrix sp. C42_A2020_038]